ncbi:putative RNA methyltransferase NDAI_0C04290 [Naumovozyma dairenensis CBS 421]|uniref:Methyltransferase OMS1, mitochondrial n=1 Tax=Naumovozyma dairenensis (strain ATCC 10597 / BCRC 20456 / CBS 421 / NBRC 0211 / NRRL Y-12639) TaxID=1071378 RepID=G0W8H8_NAUDC|nr:hypothetical protein NDAI_0C04290 [Naumovozyma dairenensis CBS 421]CCD24089.1 hypothetical protein NDAI_0C04290 [Naumovozyma dairenensis CBS 421]
MRSFSSSITKLHYLNGINSQRSSLIISSRIPYLSQNRCRYKSTLSSRYDASINRRNNTKKPTTKEEIAREKYEEMLKSPYRIVRWGAFVRSDSFSKKLTKYLIVLYIIFLVNGVQYMKKMYSKEKELERLIKKRDEEGGCNEFELLRIKELNGKLRTRDVLKLKEYRRLQEEENVSNLDGIVLDNNDENKLNEMILPARDTTEFYEHKAEEYDKSISFEERMIGMGKRRKWLMKHCHGDVLEVSSGTGRNIKYINPEKISSITFLDSSEKMMEITVEKFKKRFPWYKKVAFVVGKAENLLNLAGQKMIDDDIKKVNDIQPEQPDVKVKYDTIIETFGLCSHEDPVKALNNFSKLLKPGGRVILLEHGRGEYDFINKILDKRSEKRLKTWGCRWNLDLGEILDDSELEIVEEKRSHLGTTWCIVAKHKGDSKKKEEIGFLEKYFSSAVKNKIEAASTSVPVNDKN